MWPVSLSRKDSHHVCLLCASCKLPLGKSLFIPLSAHSYLHLNPGPVHPRGHTCLPHHTHTPSISAALLTYFGVLSLHFNMLPQHPFPGLCLGSPGSCLTSTCLPSSTLRFWLNFPLFTQVFGTRSTQSGISEQKYAFPSKPAASS